MTKAKAEARTKGPIAKRQRDRLAAARSEKRSGTDRRASDELNAGRRAGHSVAPGPHSPEVKHLAKANGWTWTPYDEDRRAGGSVYGLRVRQRRGGRWRGMDRRIGKRRARAVRMSKPGIFLHPALGETRERRASPERREPRAERRSP